MKKLTINGLRGLIVGLTLALVAVFVPLNLSPVASAACEDGKSLQDGVSCGDTGTVPVKLFGDGSIFTTVINVLLFIIGAISVIMLIIGGIRYTVSGGDAGNVTAAKNTILYALIGLVVAFLAFAIVNWVLDAITPTV